MKGKKKWYQGEIGKDIPITIVGLIVEVLIIIGIYAEILWVYR